MLTYLLVALAVSVAINIVLFIVAFIGKTDRFTDASYAISFVALALYGLLYSSVTTERAIIFGMVALWAVRLGGFLVMRIWRSGIDHRFDDIRGSFIKFGTFWVSQGISAWLIMLAALLALGMPSPTFTMLSYIGMAVWVSGLLIEGTADTQKYRFSSNPANKNRWIHTGLWRYSRHPNYFGEILVWSGVYITVFDSLQLQAAAVALISPLFITALLLFISGIPMLERSADKKWGNESAYKEYRHKTSPLIPWLPKR